MKKNSVVLVIMAFTMVNSVIAMESDVDFKKLSDGPASSAAAVELQSLPAPDRTQANATPINSVRARAGAPTPWPNYALGQAEQIERNRRCCHFWAGITIGMITHSLLLLIPDNRWPFPCVAQSEEVDMTDQCYTMHMDKCGTCEAPAWGSPVQCPVNGTVNAKQLADSIKEKLSPICGATTQYCLTKAPCNSPGGFYTCNNDMSPFIAYVKKECQKTIKAKKNTSSQLDRGNNVTSKFIRTHKHKTKKR